MEEQDKLKSDLQAVESIIRKEDDLSAIAKVLGLNPEELQALIETDPMRFLHTIYMTAESKFEELEKLNKNLHVDDINKKDIWDNVKGYIDFMKMLPMMSAQTEAMLRAWPKVEQLFVIHSDMVAIKATEGAAYMLVIQRYGETALSLQQDKQQVEAQSVTLKTKEEKLATDKTYLEGLKLRLLDEYDRIDKLHVELLKFKNAEDINRKAEELLKARDSLQKAEENGKKEAKPKATPPKTQPKPRPEPQPEAEGGEAIEEEEIEGEEIEDDEIRRA